MRFGSFACAVAFIAAGGSAAAEQWTQVKKAESVVQLDLPALGRAHERYAWSTDFNSIAMSHVAILTPPAGSFPRAHFMYQQAHPGSSFRPGPRLDKGFLTASFIFLRERSVVFDAGVLANVADGRETLRFQVEQADCIGFYVQPDGATPASPAVRRRVFGYYCAPLGIKLVAHDIQLILSGVQILDAPGGRNVQLAPTPAPVRTALTQASGAASSSMPAAGSSSADDVAARLQELKRLLDDKLITPTDYAARRKAIIDRL